MVAVIYLYFLVIFIGIIAGIFTGLIPGVHINLISMLLLTYFVFLLKFFEINFLVIFIIVMGVTHTFIDFIPSVIFGIPDSDTALSVLPAHRLVLNGEAYKAIFLSSIGSLFGMFFSIFFVILFYFFLENFYLFIKNYIWIFLIFVLIISVFLERTISKKFWALFVVFLSVGFGFLILNSSILSSPLLVLFSGFFGISSILNSILENESKLPEQKFNFDFNFDLNFFKAVFVGGISSSICSTTPGIGNSQAATMATLFFKNISSELFIVCVSSINTINFILSFMTFYLISKARNGSVFVISQITPEISFGDLFFYFLIIILVSIIGFFLTLLIGKKLIKIVFKLNLKLINLSVLILIFIIIFYFSGFFGILVLIASTMLGYFTILIGIRRVNLMAVLLVPVIFNLI